MCVPAPVIYAVTAVATSLLQRRQQRDTTPQIARNEVPPTPIIKASASGSPDPEKLKGEDETITVGTTNKQKGDRQRVREGLKTLGAVDPATASLPSAPAQGISTPT